VSFFACYSACLVANVLTPLNLTSPSAGDCYFSQKALAAQDAGAAAVLLFDNVLGAYFVPKDDSGESCCLSCNTLWCV
jgi:hypothetical protein